MFLSLFAKCKLKGVFVWLLNISPNESFMISISLLSVQVIEIYFLSHHCFKTSLLFFGPVSKMSMLGAVNSSDWFQPSAVGDSNYSSQT